MDSNPLGPSSPQAIGSLSPDEKKLLAQQLQSTVKLYKNGFIICCVLFFTIIGLIAAPAMYIGMRRAQKRVSEIENSDLKVYRVSGILESKNVGARGVGMYALSVGGFTLPEADTASLNRVTSSDYVGRHITAEYIPAIAKNRCYYDDQGNGYNFITKTTLKR